MTMPKRQQLNLVIELTKRMQQKAELGEWDELNQLEQKRQQLLKHIFSENDAQMNSDLQADLEKLISLNSELEKFCQSKKQALQLEMQGFNKNKQAINAYKSV